MAVELKPSIRHEPSALNWPRLGPGSVDAHLLTTGFLEAFTLPSDPKCTVDKTAARGSHRGVGNLLGQQRAPPPEGLLGLWAEHLSVSFPPRLWARCGGRARVHSGALATTPKPRQSRRNQTGPNGCSNLGSSGKGRFEHLLSGGTGSKTAKTVSTQPDCQRQ